MEAAPEGTVLNYRTRLGESLSRVCGRFLPAIAPVFFLWSATLKNVLLAALASVALIVSHSAQADTFYWDVDAMAAGNATTGTGLGGTGTWDASTANWWNGVSTDQAWSNAGNDTAVFTGTPGVLTLGTGITVGGLQFDTAGYVIGLAANANTLTFGAATNNIVLNNIGGAMINGSFAGAAGNAVVISGGPTAGILQLTGTGAGLTGWSGATTLNNGVTLSLRENSRALMSTSGITLNGGGITLTNTTAAEAALDRVANGAGIISNGGTFTVTNTVAAGTPYSETIGAVALTSGHLNILSTAANTGGTQNLTLSGLTQAGNSAVAFGIAGGGGVGIATNQINITGFATTAANQIIGPWATVGTTAISQTDYASYNRNAGTVNALGVQGAGIAASAETTWTTATDSFTQGSSQTLTATRTMTSLRNTAATATTALNANNLETFGLLNGATTLWTISGAGAIRQQGTAAANLYVTTGAGAITISSVIADNTGALSLVKSGANTLTLNGLNTFTGGLTIQGGGTLATASTGTFNGGSAGPLGAASNAAANIVIDNGTLSAGITTDHLFTVGAGGATILGNLFNFTNAGALAFTGSGARTITFSGGSTNSIFAPLIGDGAGGATSVAKTTSGRTNLTNTNTYTGGTIVTSGAILGVTGTNESLSTGNVTVTAATGNANLQLANVANLRTASTGGTAKVLLNSNASFSALVALGFNPTQTQAQNYLDSNSSGVLSLFADAAHNQTNALDMALIGGGSLFLGGGGTNTAGTGNITTYTATSLGVGAGNVYRLGGGSTATSLISFSNDVLLNGSGNTLLIGAPGGASGVRFTTGNAAFTGVTTVNTGVLSLFGASGTLTGPSVITANTNRGGTGTLTFDSSTASVTGATRASSVTLQGGILTTVGNSSSNSTERITNALTVGAGSNTATITGQATRNDQLVAGSLARSDNGTVLFRGLSLGNTTIASNTINTTNISFGTSPAAQLVGGGGAAGTTTISILPYAVGGITAASNGTSFVTYDANGIRPLNTATEYLTTFTNGATLTDNINVGATGVTGINSATTINSLLLSGAGGVQGTGALTVTSGAVFASASAGIGTTTAGTLAFGANEGILGAASGITLTIANTVTGTGGVTTGLGAGTTALSGVLNFSGGNGFTVNGNTTLSGASANTFTGTTTVNGGTLSLSKTTGVTAVTGDLVLNAGSVTFGSAISNQIANTSSVTLNSRATAFTLSSDGSETVANFTMHGGAVTVTGSASSSTMTVTGTTTLDGGNWTLQGRSPTWTTGATGGVIISGGTNLINGNNSAGTGIAALTVGTGGLEIDQPTSGAFTALSLTNSISTNVSSIARVNLLGDLTFVGNGGNANSTVIDATVTGTGGQSQNEILLNTGANAGTATRTFAIGNGGADVDLIIRPTIKNGGSGTTAGALTKTGAGTLELQGANTYTGATTINAGTLLISGNQSSATGAVSVNNSGTLLGGTGTIGGAVTVNAGANISGATSGTVGTLTLKSTATFTGASGSLASYLVDISGATSDKLAITGSLNLSALFDKLAFTGIGDGTTTYVLATYSSVSGTFDTVTGLPAGYQLVYGATELDLVPVPEPATWVGAALALAFLGWSQLRKGSRAGRARLSRNRTNGNR